MFGTVLAVLLAPTPHTVRPAPQFHRVDKLLAASQSGLQLDR